MKSAAFFLRRTPGVFRLVFAAARGVCAKSALCRGPSFMRVIVIESSRLPDLARARLKLRAERALIPLLDLLAAPGDLLGRPS